MLDKGIINVRVDERLIHGQVASYWTNNLGATRIMIVDDVVVKNEIEKMALKTAVPTGVRLSILTAKGASEKILSGKYIGQKVFLIVRKPITLCEMVNYGIEFDTINVGNMASKPGAKQIKKSVCLTEEDIKNFKFLDEKGIKLIAQMVPDEKQLSLMSLI